MKLIPPETFWTLHCVYRHMSKHRTMVMLRHGAQQHEDNSWSHKTEQ